MELLAPAGNKEALLAALHNGADAVYLGYTAFGARAGAGNFDEAGLEEAVGLCHLHHARVYATVNTLVKEEELAQLYRVLSLLNQAGVDAVLLQDLGAAALGRDCFPGLIRHASTQMSIHNAQGAEFLKREGFRRVVLARECSLQEIRAAADTGLEVEVFVHGALCVCVSGQCLFSSLAGGRSGNRGRCAQPCRMGYEFDGAQGYWLSPRDLMLRDKLPELKAAGVTALKIEGRLKRPEYVALVTRAYRRALDSLEEGRFTPADEGEKEGLRQIFHRGGFMPGYAGNSQDAGVIDLARPGHGGIAIGQVTGRKPGFAQVRLIKDLHDGDGLQFRGASEGETTYSGPPVKAGETALIRLREGLVPETGDQVVRLTDALQMKEAMAVQVPAIPVDMALQAEPGMPARLTATDGEVRVEITGEQVEPAQAKPITLESARKAFSKTGDTDFILRDLALNGEGGFLPVSSLNALRREALDKLALSRSRAFGARDFTELPMLPAAFPPARAAAPRLLVRSRDAALGKRLLNAGAELFVYEPEDYALGAMEKACEQLPEGAWLVLPVQARKETLQKLKDFASGRFAGVVLGSIGQAGIGLNMAGGEGIPAFNSRTAMELSRLGLKWLTISPELNAGEIQGLPLGGFPFVLTVYGRARLMTLNHCPARTALGLDRGREACRLCGAGSSHGLQGKGLKDGAGREFPLLRTHLPEGCLVNVYNTLPLSLAGKAESLQSMGWQLDFTTESPEEQLEITACFAALRKGLPCPAPLPKGTAGHYHRGVE